MFTKLTRYSVHWSSKILTNYKRDAIAGELNRVKKILRFNKGLHFFSLEEFHQSDRLTVMFKYVMKVYVSFYRQ